jgi:hypothetical protein
MPKTIDKLHVFVPVDVFNFCVWDEDLGVMITPNGVEKCLKAAQECMEDGWKFEEIEFRSDEDEYFFLKMSRNDMLAKKKPRKVSRTCH